MGKLPEVASSVRGVEHLVLLSATGITTDEAEASVGGIFGAFGSAASERKQLRKINREAKVKPAGFASLVSSLWC